MTPAIESAPQMQLDWAMRGDVRLASVNTDLDGLATAILQLLSVMKVGSGLTMIFASITAAFVIRGLTGDTLKQMIWGEPCCT